MQNTAKRLSLIALIMMLLTSLLFGSAISAEAKTTLTLSKTKTTIHVGYSEAITVKINGKKADAKKCTFKSSKTSVATVSSKGNIKAVKAGSATITVTLKSNKKVKKTCKVTVKKNTITATYKSFTFSTGGSGKIKVIKVNGKAAGGGTLNYKSSNKAIATVSSDGTVKGIKKGTATITASMKRDATTKIALKITVVNSKNYTISPSSLPVNAAYLHYDTFNSNTKNHFLIRSYLEEMEKLGGGTLTLNAGTYKITNPLYIPSNVKIVLKNGVEIKKTSVTGTSKLLPSGSVFMFVEPSKANTTGAHSLYNGVHDSSIIGEGNAVIDMSNAPENKHAIAITLGHNKNITISGVNFKNLELYGHFIELDASNNVTVSNCNFTNALMQKSSKSGECINIDLPDKKTGGFNQVWTSYDCTPNKNITISDCEFKNVQAGVGTHQYTPEKFHTNINIINNTFESVVTNAISIYNWKDSIISQNIINGTGRRSNGEFFTDLGYDLETLKKTHAIRGVGAYNITMEGNTLMHSYDIYFYPKEETAYGYPMSMNGLSEADIDYIAENNVFIDDGLNDIIPSYPGQVRMRDSHDGIYDSGYHYTRYIKTNEDLTEETNEDLTEETNEE